MIEEFLPEQIKKRLAARRADLVDQYREVLSETLFTNRAEVRPSVLGRIAAAEAETFFAFIERPQAAMALERGVQLCRIGLSEETLFCLGRVTRRACWINLPEDLRFMALEIFAAYHMAVMQGFIQTLRTLILDEQEKIRAAIQNALTSRTAQLETLITVAQSINATLDLDLLLNGVVELLKERYGYYFVSIFLLDKSGNYMLLRAGTGAAGQQLVAEGFRLKVGEQGLIGWVAQHQQGLCVNDISTDPRYVSSAMVPATQAELVLPLQVGSNFLGVLDLQSDRRNVFTGEGVRIFESLANHIALATQNALAYQNQQTRLLVSETLYTIGQALSKTLELQKVLDLILENLAQIVPFDRGSVMLKNGADMEVVAARGFPLPLDPLQIRVSLQNNGDDLFNEICQTKRPLLIPEVLEWPNWQQMDTLPQARSWMGVPLLHDDEVIGMLSLTQELPNPYSADEALFAETFAGQAAIAMYNAGLYEQLARAHEQLARLDRAKSDFITVVSHELRTPVTVLQGFSQILRRDAQIKANTTQMDMVEGIYSGAVRLHEIVNTMLDIAKIDSQSLRLYAEGFAIPVSLQKVISGFKEALLERNLTLTLEDANGLPDIEADEDLLLKVWYQVIGNAIKYTPDGGQITISAHLRPPGQSDLPGNAVEVLISDTGIGIDPRFHDLIFTKFYQTGDVAFHSTGITKFKGGGPGLGLAIAQGIVLAHGGLIWVESPGYDEEVCPGSRFHVLLPMQQPGVQAVQQ